MRIPDARVRTGNYPHQFSGGMQQRALTAMALSMEPPLILADEPTTALDVTIQAEIIALIRDLRAQTGTSFLFISHDLGLVSSLCDRIYVMYAGEIVESGARGEIFGRPCHPLYARAHGGGASPARESGTPVDHPRAHSAAHRGDRGLPFPGPLPARGVPLRRASAASGRGRRSRRPLLAGLRDAGQREQAEEDLPCRRPVPARPRSPRPRRRVLLARGG